MPRQDAPTPSEIVIQAIGHLGGVVARMEAQADHARGQQLRDLEEQIARVQVERRRLRGKQLKKLDKDPRIKEQIKKLGDLTQQLNATREEITTVRKAIETAVKVLNIFGEIVKIAAKAL